MKKTIFLTGATGFLGCHLAHRFLADGHRVVALVRQKKESDSLERLRRAILLVGDLPSEILENLLVLSGTVQDDAATLVANYRTVAGEHIAEVWHSAAIFNFRPRDKEKVTAVNINGTQNLLNFATQVNEGEPPRFFYISTAYCLGRENNTAVPETLPHNISDFRSVYEWSKHEAELRVEQMQQTHGLDAFILRPSIIIGTPETLVPCDSGYYQVVTECQRLRDFIAQALENYDGNVDTRLIGDTSAPLNLVPIDFVVNGMLLLAGSAALRGSRLKIFNLINEQPPAIKIVHEAVTDSLQVDGLALVDKAVFEEREMTMIEEMVNRRIAFQIPYMHEQIIFTNDCFRAMISEEQLPTPRVDVPYLKQLNEIFLS